MVLGSLEQSPRLLETYGGDSDSSFGVEELKIQEDIADAMIESPVSAALKNGAYLYYFSKNIRFISLCKAVYLRIFQAQIFASKRNYFFTI